MLIGHRVSVRQSTEPIIHEATRPVFWLSQPSTPHSMLFLREVRDWPSGFCLSSLFYKRSTVVPVRPVLSWPSGFF